MTTRPETPAPRAVRPEPAERARTVAAGPGATVCATGVEATLPLAHAVTADGQLLLVVPADGELAAAIGASPQRDVSALVMVSDRAPVPLRRPVRAQMWLSGWATPVAERDARAAVLAFADVRPAPALLDVGTTAVLLRLDLAEVVLREGGAVAEVGPEEFAAAAPDPLAGVEAATLAHLDRDHPEFLDRLAARLPRGEVGPGDVVRPLGLDRFGLRLRIERRVGHQDVRLTFPQPLTCPGQLGAAMRALTCAGAGG
ncbi:DUF2470 domain-containing protein [Geodermatophilus sp. SYSU D00815]